MFRVDNSLLVSFTATLAILLILITGKTTPFAIQALPNLCHFRLLRKAQDIDPAAVIVATRLLVQLTDQYSVLSGPYIHTGVINR